MTRARPGSTSQLGDERERRGPCRLVDEDDADRFRSATNLHAVEVPDADGRAGDPRVLKTAPTSGASRCRSRSKPALFVRVGVLHELDHGAVDQHEGDGEEAVADVNQNAFRHPLKGPWSAL